MNPTGPGNGEAAPRPPAKDLVPPEGAAQRAAESKKAGETKRLEQAAAQANKVASEIVKASTPPSGTTEQGFRVLANDKAGVLGGPSHLDVSGIGLSGVLPQQEQKAAPSQPAPQDVETIAGESETTEPVAGSDLDTTGTSSETKPLAAGVRPSESPSATTSPSPDAAKAGGIAPPIADQGTSGKEQEAKKLTPEEIFVAEQIAKDETARAALLQKGKTPEAKGLQEILQGTNPAEGETGYRWNYEYPQGSSREGQKRTLDDIMLDIREEERLRDEAGISPEHRPRPLTAEENRDRDRVKDLYGKWKSEQANVQRQDIQKKQVELDKQLQDLGNDTSAEANKKRKELQAQQADLSNQQMAIYKMEADGHSHGRNGIVKARDRFAVWLAGEAGDKRIKEHFREWRGYREMYKSKAEQMREVVGAKNTLDLWIKRATGQLKNLPKDTQDKVDALQKQMDIFSSLAGHERNEWARKNVFRLVLLWAFIIGPAALTLIPALLTAKAFQMGGKAGGG